MKGRYKYSTRCGRLNYDIAAGFMWLLGAIAATAIIFGQIVYYGLLFIKQQYAKFRK